LATVWSRKKDEAKRQIMARNIFNRWHDFRLDWRQDDDNDDDVEGSMSSVPKYIENGMYIVEFVSSISSHYTALSDGY